MISHFLLVFFYFDWNQSRRILRPTCNEFIMQYKNAAVTQKSYISLPFPRRWSDFETGANLRLPFLPDLLLPRGCPSDWHLFRHGEGCDDAIVVIRCDLMKKVSQNVLKSNYINVIQIGVLDILIHILSLTFTAKHNVNFIQFCIFFGAVQTYIYQCIVPF